MGLSAKDLKALEHLPAVTRALEKLAVEESRLRAAMAKTGVATTTSGAVLQPVPVRLNSPTTNATGPVNLQTPERQEYENERTKKQKAYLESVMAERDAKLAQFRQQPGVEPETVVTESTIETISGEAG